MPVKCELDLWWKQRECEKGNIFQSIYIIIILSFGEMCWEYKVAMCGSDDRVWGKGGIWLPWQLVEMTNVWRHGAVASHAWIIVETRPLSILYTQMLYQVGNMAWKTRKYIIVKIDIHNGFISHLTILQ